MYSAHEVTCVTYNVRKPTTTNITITEIGSAGQCL